MTYFSANTSEFGTKNTKLTYKREKVKQNDKLENKRVKINVSDLKNYIRDKKVQVDGMSNDTLDFFRFVLLFYPMDKNI